MRMVMTPLPIVVVLLLLTASDGLAVVGTTSSLINTTCAAASNITDRGDYDLCVRVLSADPVGASATDARGLAAVAANLTAANVTSTVLVLEDLVGNLRSCLGYYRMMNASVAGALDDIRAGRAEAASKKLDAATNEPDNCDILLFQGSAMKNPMWQENRDANFLSYMAYGISMEVLHAQRQHAV